MHDAMAAPSRHSALPAGSRCAAIHTATLSNSQRPSFTMPCSGAGLEGWKPPNSAAVRGSLAGYWRALKGLSSRARTANDLALLHVPQEGVTALRAMAAGEASAAAGQGGSAC